MSRVRTTVGLLAIAALALFGAGCGEDDDSGDSGESADNALTKAEFVQQANAICAEGNAELDAVSANFGPGTGPAEIEAFVTDTVVPNIENQIEGLRALTPPEGDEETVDELLTAAEEGVDEAEANPESITGQGPDPFAEANQLARDYGLTVCGRG